MVSLQRILTDGLILSAIAVFFLLIVVVINPRLMLQDYPKPIQAVVPPKTEKEKKQTLIFGLPFLLTLLGGPFIFSALMATGNPGDLSFWALFLYAAGIVFVFNLVDWLVLDWLIFCTLTPKMFVIPGSEGNSAYKDYGFHFRGFLIGTMLSVVIGLISSVVIWLVF